MMSAPGDDWRKLRFNAGLNHIESVGYYMLFAEYAPKPSHINRLKGKSAMQELAIDPDLDLGVAIARQADADSLLCWTCGTCDSECPVFRSTERLRPQETVRMANLGMIEDLLKAPQIWYCLSCRRCVQGCPNRVKPYELHRHLQHEAIATGVISSEMIAPYRKLFIEFQRVRWRVAAHCFKAPLEAMPSQLWYKWLKTPLRQSGYYISETVLPSGQMPRLLPSQDDGKACFTCSECSTCCPIFGERNVFDPQRIIRMANLGLDDQVLKSPSIWLCLGCRRCTDYCTQLVRGHDIIRRFQDEAIAKGVVDPWYPNRLLEADRLIYPRFLDEIDALLGLYAA